MIWKELREVDKFHVAGQYYGSCYYKGTFWCVESGTTGITGFGYRCLIEKQQLRRGKTLFTGAIHSNIARKSSDRRRVLLVDEGINSNHFGFS
jgi:hypothetical protein